MKVSVITACLNCERTVAKAVQSILIQDYKFIEHIVQDGLSVDKTVSIIRNLSPQSRIFIEPDSGIFDALNKAVDKAKGDIIAILHADDYYTSSDVIQKVVQHFQEKECDAVYGDLIYVDRTDNEKVVRHWKSGEYKEGSFLRGWMPPHPAFFVRREILLKYGVYDLSFGTAADYEWMLRLIHRYKIRLSYIPEILVAMRTGGSSNKNLAARLRANREDRRAWKANGLKPRWYTLILKPLSKIRQWS